MSFGPRVGDVVFKGLGSPSEIAAAIEELGEENVRITPTERILVEKATVADAPLFRAKATREADSSFLLLVVLGALVLGSR